MPKSKLATSPAIRVVVTRYTGWVTMPTGPAEYLLDGVLRRADDDVVRIHPHYFESVPGDQERTPHRA